MVHLFKFSIDFALMFVFPLVSALQELTECTNTNYMLLCRQEKFESSLMKIWDHKIPI